MLEINQKDRELLASASYKEFLATEIINRKLKNQSYSLRAMARDLQIPASSLSTVINTQKNFKAESIERISKNLQKPEPVGQFFMHLAMAEINAPGDIYNPDYMKARELRLKYLYVPSEAPHRMVDGWSLATFSLTLLLKIEGELKTNEALCQRLNVSMDTLKHMIEELQSLGWLQPSAQGPKSCINYLEFGNQGNAYEIRNVHKKTLQQADWSLEHLPIEKRFYYNSYFTMSPDRIAAISDKMRTFALSTGEAEEPTAPGHEIYVLGTFIIPLTHR